MMAFKATARAYKLWVGGVMLNDVECGSGDSGSNLSVDYTCRC